MISQFLWISCTPNINYKIPNIYWGTEFSIYDFEEDGIIDGIAVGYNIDEDNFSDFIALHTVVGGAATKQPIMVIYLKDGKEFARQNDSDYDGTANWVSGDLKELKNILSKINNEK